MDSGAHNEDLAVLFERHATLESKYGDGDGGRFLSGWQCENPHAAQIDEIVRDGRRGIRNEEYLYFDRDPEVINGVAHFHQVADGQRPSAVLCGLGATSLIFIVCAWLREHNVNEIFYVPPLYFSAHFALKILGIRARPISARHVFEHDFSFNLPKEKTVLFLADPVWYAGTAVPRDTISALIDWQRDTGSLVFVDGSFQYCRWDGSQVEPSAHFDSEHTIRAVCPTKPLAAHGYRFAYLLLPKRMYDECAHIYASTYGSTSAENLALARAAPLLLLDGSIPRSLMMTAAQRHQLLRARRVISAPWQPDCGYFVFEKIHTQLPTNTLLMDGSFFDQRRYPDFKRINLLSPSITMLN